MLIKCQRVVVRLRYYIPWAVAAGIAIAIGGGLISTWDAHSNLGHVFGYQLVLAIRGLGMQVVSTPPIATIPAKGLSQESNSNTQGIIAIQNNFPSSEIAIANAVLIFTQNFFAAVSVTIGNAIFQEGLTSEIDANVPGVDSDAAIAAGGSAEAVRAIAPPGSPQLAGLLEAYSTGVSHVSYLILAMGVVTTFASFGMGWVDLSKTRTKKPSEKKTEEGGEKKEPVKQEV